MYNRRLLGAGPLWIITVTSDEPSEQVARDKSQRAEELEAETPKREVLRSGSRRLATVLVGIALVGVVVVALFSTSTPKQPVNLPPVTFHLANGGTLVSPWGTLAHPKQSTVLVFFASWCEPCKRELPALTSYLSHHRSDKVAVIGLDGREDKPSDGIAFARAANFTDPVAVDPRYDLVSGLFNLPGFPDTVFIAANGEMVERHVGPLSQSAFAHQYQALAER